LGFGTVVQVEDDAYERVKDFFKKLTFCDDYVGTDRSMYGFTITRKGGL
jgi:hypothetical protein